MGYDNVRDDVLLNPGPVIKEALLDSDPLMYVRRINTDGSPSATGSIAVTSTTITFYSSNDATVPEGGSTSATNFPDITGKITNGAVDLSAYGSAPVTWGELVNLINAQPNWEAWLVGARPDVAIVDADLLAQAVAATTAGVTSADGAPIYGDTSAVKAIALGITHNGSTQLGSKHNNDVGVNHVLSSVIANITSASGTLETNLYECDDDAGTSTLVATLIEGMTSGTEATYAPAGGIHTAQGKRLVVEVVGGAPTAGYVKAVASTMTMGPGRPGFYASDNG